MSEARFAWGVQMLTDYVQKCRWASGNAGKWGICMYDVYVWSSYFIGVSMLHDACADCYNIHRSLTAAQCQWWYSYHLQTSPPLDTAIRVVYPAAVTSEKASGKIFAHSENICWGPRHCRPALVSPGLIASGALTSVSLCRGPGGASVQTRHVSRQFLRDDFDPELCVHLQKFVVVRLLSKWQQKL